MNHLEFYYACNLKDNPFRSTPAIDSDPRMRIWVGYQREKEILTKFLTRSRTDMVGNTNLLLVYGDYGNGKSHSLLWAKNHIQTDPDFDSLVFYIQTLKKDAGKLTFAGALSHDIVGKSNLVGELLNFKGFIESRIQEHISEHNIPSSTPRDVIIDSILGSHELSGFAKQIRHCDNEEDVKNLIIPDKVSDYQAMTTFANIVNLFTYKFVSEDRIISFKKGMYLFIDELDLLQHSPAKELREVNDLIRHLYDLCPNAFCIVLAFTATAAEVPILFAEYLMSRVSKQIVLEPLGPDEAKDFIRDIMDGERNHQSGEVGCYPFEEGAIDLIVGNLVTITPRKIINVMQQVLEEVRLLDHEPSRNNLVTQDFLDTNNVIDDIVI